MDNPFWKQANAIMNRLMPFLTPAGVVVGFLLGARIVPAAFLVKYLFAFVTLSGALGMNSRDFIGLIRNPIPILLAILSAHLITPLCVSLVVNACFPTHSDIANGFILLSATPMAVSSYIWITIFYGNGPLGLSLILIDTLLAPFICPLTISIFTQSAVTIDTTGMMISLLVMVVVPSILGLVCNSVFGDAKCQKASMVTKPFSKLCLFLVICLNAAKIAGEVTLSWDYMPIAFVNVMVTIGGFLIGYLLSRICGLGMPDTISVTTTAGLRNISAALVLAIDFFPSESAIPVLFGIMLQQTLIAFTGKGLFGRYQKRMIAEENKVRMPGLPKRSFLGIFQLILPLI